MFWVVFFIKQKTAYEMRSSDWSSDVCSSDLIEHAFALPRLKAVALVINSPGGSASQSALIAKRIRDMAREKDVPVLAFCEDVAASEIGRASGRAECVSPCRFRG